MFILPFKNRSSQTFFLGRLLGQMRRAMGVCMVLLCWLFSSMAHAEIGANSVTKPRDMQTPSDFLPLEISPEGVKALIGSNTPFILLDADRISQTGGLPPGLMRRIYYTTTPSFRSAQRLAAQDIKGRSSSSLDASSSDSGSQRLTGTPLEWHRLGLPFAQNPFPVRPAQITPRQLSEAIKDGVDLQIIDLMPAVSTADASSFPQAFHWLPHQVESNLPKLSKQRWVVLIDGGNRVAQPIAEQLFQQGYLLITVLEGGYPAWVSATDR
jgi:rhodanese-related sulfurtransferase